MISSKNKTLQRNFSFNVLTCLIFQITGCDKDSGDETEQINITGNWELTTTVTSSTCGLPAGYSRTEFIDITDNEGSFTITNFDGQWGSGTVKGNSLSFTGSETSDDFGCSATLTTEGTATATETEINGSLATAVIFKVNVCSGFTNCSIFFDLSMTRLEESPCMDRAVFGDPGNSQYILPYPVGASYVVYQSYCCTTGGHRNQLAYDFEIPIGDTIIASRGGVVRWIREDSPDDGEGVGEHNCVHVEHEDGTVAFYAHLMQNSVIVEPDDTLKAGDYFARSGNSGYSGEPHLHFGVYEDYPTVEGEDVPVSFKNAEGLLDEKGGLIRGESYKALPY